jgi:hypothetical protein
MPVDEFGREIPGVGALAAPRGEASGSLSSNIIINDSRGGRSSRDRDSGGGGRDRDRDRDRDGGSYRERERSYSGTMSAPRRPQQYPPPPPSDRHRDHGQHHGGGGGRDRDRDGHHNNQSPGRDRDRDRAGPSHHSQSSSSNRRSMHPSERYADEPMLCQFVWKTQTLTVTQEQEEKERAARKEDNGKNGDDDNDNDNDDDVTKQKEESQDDAVGVPTKASKDGGDEAAADGDAMVGDDSEGGPPKEENPEAEDTQQPAYDEYRRRYCLNYVRAFFNKHLDDSWFRNRYSPACRKRIAEQEQQRAVSEAQLIRHSIEESLKEAKADTNADSANVVPSFVKQARLGGGVKQSASAPRKRRLSGDLDDPHRSTTASTSHSTTPMSHSTTAVPLPHVIASTSNALYVHEIPPHVTDDQLMTALMDHCTIPADQRGAHSALKVYSSSPSTSLPSLSTSHSDNRKQRFFLQRSAFVVCPVLSMQQDILRNLKKMTTGEGDANSKKHVPRKADEDDNAANQRLPLDVECSDPYGRLEYDADGKGGAPADSLAVPPRKSVVLVSAPLPPEKLQIVKVLSAALSSKERIPRDYEATCLIGRALDVAKQIPRGCRLDDMLEQLFANSESSESATMVEDMLDISIAYLRRVHLFSLYNGCTMADSVADVLAGKHPVSTIHVRLQNADEILEAAKDDLPATTTVKSEDADKNEVSATKDLLVQRLDDSIAKALENCNVWVNSSSDDDPDVAAVQEAELDAEETWLEKHSSLDDDSRARCRFHFCHKLFKDSSFLHKHLLKKHVEYVTAEKAKCHDEFMMKAWDAESHRPVPDVLVDCGSIFGLVPAVVQGQIPDAEDPEPGLWQKEEERRKRDSDMRQRNEEMRQQRNQQRQQQPQGEFGNEGNRGSQGGGARPSQQSGSGFVDVDDMKEEKMEVSFDNVEIPAVAPKRKKKKRKLL